MTISSSDVFVAGCGSGGVITRTWTATNTCGTASCEQTVTIIDTTPPTISAAGANATIQCPASPVFTAPTTANDICDPSPTVIEVSDVTTPGCGGTNSRVKTWKARDCAGNESGTVSQTIQVVDTTAPVVTITGPASGAVYAVGTPVSFTATFTDACGSPHTATWTFDVNTQPGVVTEGAPGTVTASHTFTAAGVYMVSLAVTDACGNAATSNQVGGVDAMVVIFDPNAGFVTGGGWINSPAGAYTADPSLTGKANFGFVSKYKKGASIPTGETEFQYKLGNLNFHSTSYQWLVVAGARAQYKGTGTINNAGSYGFILTAIDGQISGGGGADKFRMKITESGGGLVYDNLLNAPDSDDPTTVLGGGSIVIHTGGNSASAAATGSREENGGDPSVSGAAVLEYGLSQNHPNPFDRSTLIGFSLPERSRIRLAVYDLGGREVRVLADGEWEAGRHSATMTRASRDGNSLSAGVYFVRMSSRSL